MKIYTKTGDKGATALVGGTRVSKTDLRVEAYGTVDELISHIGLLRSYPVNAQQSADLLRIQQDLMVASALLASDGGPKQLPEIQPEAIKALESAIDDMDTTLPALHAFLLPGPPAAAAQCHVARCVCRRAERTALKAAQQHTINENVITYLNRLSDYLFVLARQLTHTAGVDETCWLP